VTFNNIHDKVGELEKKGNESREAGNYTEALDLYSKAIAMEKSNKNNSRRIAHLRNEKGLIYYQMKKFVFYSMFFGPSWRICFDFLRNQSLIRLIGVIY
jgi:tetratricopeptide (TPR) repeat protein